MSDRAIAIGKRVERFVRDQIVPFERDPRCGAHGPSDALVHEMHALARSAFFMTEPATDGGAGSDPSMMLTTARPDGNHWVIDGRKAFITGADGANVGIIMAKSEGGACMFLVDLPDPAIRIERILDTIDSSMPGVTPSSASTISVSPQTRCSDTAARGSNMRRSA
jgi:Acyl-CoA dehydrogenase, middle domain